MHVLDSYIKFLETWSLSGNPSFVEDDFDVESIFRSAFGGDRIFYWSFINDENPQWRSRDGFSNFRKSWKWRHQNENEYDSSTESESESDQSYSGLVSDRLALGLSASGPLKLEDVKTAWVLFLFISSLTKYWEL